MAFLCGGAWQTLIKASSLALQLRRQRRLIKGEVSKTTQRWFENVREARLGNCINDAILAISLPRAFAYVNLPEIVIYSLARLFLGDSAE